MASAASTRDRVLHYIPRQVKLYSLIFHIIDIKRLFHHNKLISSWKMFLTEYVGTWASQQHKYLELLAVSLLQVRKWRWGKLSLIS